MKFPSDRFASKLRAILKACPGGAPALRGLFFCLSIPWLELLLRLSDSDILFWSIGLPRALLAGAAVGALLWLVAEAVPKKGIARGIVCVLLFLLTAITVIEKCCKAFFGAYFQVGYLTEMTGQVAGNFLGETMGVIWRNLWFFPLALLPLILFAVFRKRLAPAAPHWHWTSLAIPAAVLVVLQVAAIGLCHVGDDGSYYTTDFSANSAIPRFGLVNTLRLEAKYAIFGAPELTLPDDPALPTDPILEIDPIPTQTTAPAAEPTEATTQPTDPAETQTDPAETQTDPAETQTDPAPTETQAPTQPTPTETESPAVSEPTEVISGYNMMDIDFTTLLNSDSGTLLAMDKYFSNQMPTQQNAYTGLFEGKNLILITAEAFCSAVIDEERTPALYQLANNGFVFTNFYQPSWTQSTTGGEFANMTGIIPTWINSKTAFSASIGKTMPFALGWQFSKLGYTATAWHNSSYSYYNRNLTHPNLGYTYYGIGNGLSIASASMWPPSDLEMIQATIGDQIAAYVEDGTPFHAYYMTVSGHLNYSYSANKMSARNWDALDGWEGSDIVRAYLACNMELEYAMEYLLSALEQAGIADDTVIVLAADHYPYGLSEGSTDYYQELMGWDEPVSEYSTAYYTNTLILWCGSMEEPVVVDTPCSSVDIVPTLSNLFGLAYDSRLLSGRDLLAPQVAAGEISTAMPIVIFPDVGYGYSWITAAGTYEAYTKTFTANAGVTVSDSYVSTVSAIAQNRFTYARYLISEDYFAHVGFTTG